MHKHKLHYNVQTRQVKIAGIEIDQIVAIKEQTLPALIIYQDCHRLSPTPLLKLPSVLIHFVKLITINLEATTQH